MIGTKLFRKINIAIDRNYLKKVGATQIPGSELGLMLFCFHPYHGKTPLTIPKDVIIKPGDMIGELHISNIRVLELSSNDKGEPVDWWQLWELAKGEFTLLAKACADGLVPQEIKGFYGVNVMPALARRMGFKLVPIPKGLNRWWLGVWESILRVVYYSNNAKKKTKLKKTMDAYEVWISREELIRGFAK